MLGTLNSGNLEPQNPGNLELWNLGEFCNLAILETCNCGILEPCKALEPSPITVQPWNTGTCCWVAKLGKLDNDRYDSRCFFELTLAETQSCHDERFMARSPWSLARSTVSGRAGQSRRKTSIILLLIKYVCIRYNIHIYLSIYIYACIYIDIHMYI